MTKNSEYTTPSALRQALEHPLGLSMAEAFEVVRSFYLALPQSK